MAAFFSSKSHANILIFQWYRHAHAKDMPLRAIARLIQTMLYAKRFFPYYVYNILGGIEEDGLSSPPSFRFRHPYPNCQELARSTLLILSGHTSVRPVEPLVLLSPSSSPSSTTRQVPFFIIPASLSSPTPPTFQFNSLRRRDMYTRALLGSTEFTPSRETFRLKRSRGVFLS